MAFNIHNSHRAIFLIPALMYVVLVFLIAVVPAINAQKADEDAGGHELSEREQWGYAHLINKRRPRGA